MVHDQNNSDLTTLEGMTDKLISAVGRWTINRHENGYLRLGNAGESYNHLTPSDIVYLRNGIDTANQMRNLTTGAQRLASAGDWHIFQTDSGEIRVESAIDSAEVNRSPVTSDDFSDLETTVVYAMSHPDLQIEPEPEQVVETLSFSGGFSGGSPRFAKLMPPLWCPGFRHDSDINRGLVIHIPFWERVKKLLGFDP